MLNRYNDLLAARKKIKHKMLVAAIVMKRTGDHCVKTLNPCTTFILRETPEIMSPQAKVKLKINPVNISFKILVMSLNSERLRMNPIIRNSTPRPMVMYEEMSWLRFQVGLR